MSVNILMPALSPTMTEGTLARWLKKEGDAIRAGDVIAEIETDKATMEVEAVDEGVLGRILVADGTANVRVNEPIAVLEEAVGSVAAAPAAASAGAAAAGGPAPVQAAGEVAASVQSAGGAAPAVAVVAVGGDGGGAGERMMASPLARRMARQAGIDLAGLRGSGPGGRIVKVDVEAALPGGGAAGAARAVAGAAQVGQAAAVASAGTGAAGQAVAAAHPASAIAAPGRVVPMSNVARVTARRLTEAKQSVPHFYVSVDVELDKLLALRGELNARSPKDGDQAYKISVNDMLIKACALSLRRVPRCNASYTDDGVFMYEDVDISVAVSIPDGLITPIIRAADTKSVAAIAREGRLLFERAKAGKLKPAEFQGGSFSISNMGMYGVREFAAIINPPQAAILAVAAGEQRAVVRDGVLAVATVMTCTISVDHRVIDGALAAEWLGVFKELVQDPAWPVVVSVADLSVADRSGGFALRDAVAGDAGEIARLVRELAVYEKLEHEAVGDGAAFGRALFGAEPVAYAMVAEVDGRVVGLALWFYNFSTFQCRAGLYVEDVYVEPAHRGLGIGRAFFAAMARQAVARGCGRMEWSVLDWNAPAIAFYRGMGAVGMDAWTVQRLSGDALARLAEDAARG